MENYRMIMSMMNISFQSVSSRQVDIVPRPCHWSTTLQHVWIFATSGEGLYYRKGERNPLKISARGESLYYLPPDSWRYVNACGEKPLCLFTLHLTVRDDVGRDFFSPYLLPNRFSPGRRKQLGRFMSNLWSASQQDDASGPMEFRRHLLGFVGTILQWAQCKPVSQLPRQPGRCQNAIAHLQKQYAAELNIDFLSQLCNVSRPHFFRLFKEETGLTAQEYLCRQRLEHAKSLLLFTQKPISEIGRDVGWNDSFHFSRIFRRHIGCSPTRYRTRIGF